MQVKAGREAPPSVCSVGCVGVRAGTGKGDAAVLGPGGLEPSPFRLLGGSVALDTVAQLKPQLHFWAMRLISPPTWSV